VERCRCGFDLRTIDPKSADSNAVAIAAALYRAAGFPVGIGSEDLEGAKFPAALTMLSLDDLIGLILALGSLRRTQAMRLKFAGTDLSAAIAICGSAGDALRNWPQCFHESLRCLLPKSVKNPGALSVQHVFGNFYLYFLSVHNRTEFAFLCEAFEEFIVQYWPGIVRGQHRAFSMDTRQGFRWIPALHAARIAGVSTTAITEYARNGDLDGIFVKPAKSRERIECWVERDSLARWSPI
jgi:hypothetical protein